MPPTKNNDPQDILMALERRILHGLAAEWDLVRWRIPEPLRRQLRKPQFRIADLASSWGHWTPATNTITVSRRLMRHHPWDAIREVLLHETAHQIACEINPDPTAPPHGEAFQKACRLIGATARASGSYPLLHERIEGAATTRDDTMRLKIKKLLALAESANPNEAAAALIKARHLMARLQIEYGDAGCAEERYISAFAGFPALRHTRDHHHLSALLADFYFVEAIWVPAWVLEKEKVGCVLEISGTLESIQMAGYVHDYIRRCIESRWRLYAADRKLSRHRKTDYAVGIIQGFRSQLESRSEAKIEPDAPSGLIRMEDPQLTAYVKQKYPHLRIRRSRQTCVDTMVIKDGHQEGRQMKITTPVSGTTKTPSPAALPLLRRLPSPDIGD